MAESEGASTNEGTRRLVFEEFFYLLQRIGRLDERDAGRFDRVEARIDSLRLWVIGLIVTMLVGFGSLVMTMPYADSSRGSRRRGE